MSFGDIAPALPPASGFPPPAISELQRLLKPLAANNAALRQATSSLNSHNPDAVVYLKRIRTLREQNRQIAQAAAIISNTVDLQIADRDPDTVARASDAKHQFQSLLDDFANALTESVNAERTFVETVTNGEASPPTTVQPDRFSEGQIAIEQDTIAYKTPSENDPLLPSPRIRNPREEAALREVQSNEAFVQERRAVLADVQSSIDDVNSIFKDLAVMITDQRTQVEHVEISVSETAHNVSGARRELEKTQKRREARKRFFFVTLLSIAGIIAVFLIFLLS